MSVNALSCAVAARSAAYNTAAERLASELSIPLLPMVEDPKQCRHCDLLLWLDKQGLALQLTGPRAPGPVRSSLLSGAMAHRRQAGHNELLGRAVGVGKKQPLRVLDATAGLGRDALVLADLGCDVVMCERHQVVAALLESGLAVAQSDTQHWASHAVDRLQLRKCDCRQATLPEDIDVIYLDPMFPERGKAAAVKKDMALFQQLLSGSADAGEDADSLLDWALAQPVVRVVVKRPKRAPSLMAKSPSHVIAGKAVRFDVYVSFGLEGMRNSQRVKTD